MYAQPKGSPSIPDLSGIWTHSIPGFEPLASGPTALVNTQRRENGTGNILKLAGDYTNPILTPQAAGIVKMHAERGLNGIGDPNPPKSLVSKLGLSPTDDDLDCVDAKVNHCTASGFGSVCKPAINAGRRSA